MKAIRKTLIKTLSLDSIPFILASSSPRRVSLLEQVGMRVEICAPFSDEKALRGEKPQALVHRLALEKALSVREIVLKKNRTCFILAADTIVVEPMGRKILGKPRNEAEARRMLGQLAGKTHTVLTGYCILLADQFETDRKRVRVVSSRVKMRSLDAKTIRQYVASGEPMDKAGSYAAQGLGTALIESIQGSYTNVVGLPVTQVLKDLETDFGIPLFNWAR